MEYDLYYPSVYTKLFEVPLPHNPPEFCAYINQDRKRGHAYFHACHLTPGHGGDHELRPAHRLYWEARQGVPVPAKFYLLPRDGNWANLEPDNWELVSQRRYRKERAPKYEQKTCRDCQRTLSIDMFPAKRNSCSDCWKEHLKENTNSRRDHVSKFKCIIVNGQHHHLLTKQDVLRYWATLHLLRLKEGKTTAAYHQAVASYRKMLHNAISKNAEDYSE